MQPHATTSTCLRVEHLLSRLLHYMFLLARHSGLVSTNGLCPKRHYSLSHKFPESHSHTGKIVALRRIKPTKGRAKSFIDFRIGARKSSFTRVGEKYCFPIIATYAQLVLRKPTTTAVTLVSLALVLILHLSFTIVVRSG